MCLLDTGSQVISVLGNSYPSAGGPLTQSHVPSVNSLNSIGMLNDMSSNDSSPFDINDFPQLTSRPSSSGGPQGQLGMRRKILFACYYTYPSSSFSNDIGQSFRFSTETRSWS